MLAKTRFCPAPAPSHKLFPRTGVALTLQLRTPFPPFVQHLRFGGHFDLPTYRDGAEAGLSDASFSHRSPAKP
jgi:hypothetical protein